MTTDIFEEFNKRRFNIMKDLAVELRKNVSKGLCKLNLMA